jgi:hypothetical protein
MYEKLRYQAECSVRMKALKGPIAEKYMFTSMEVCKVGRARDWHVYSVINIVSQTATVR